MSAINSFSIVPRVYEAGLDSKYGIELGAVRNGEKTKFNGDLRKNAFFKECGDYSTRKINGKILKKYKSVPGFCSMRVGSEGELMEHVRAVHELSYNHYVFGKEKDIDGSFPNWCCGDSSRNLLLTLMERGYPNASHFYNARRDHAYNGLPFVFGDSEEKGFIILDPTSDQLFNNKKHAPRNNVFVVPGARWKYETDWGKGVDLFPSSGDRSRFANLHTLRKVSHSDIYESTDIKKYFCIYFFD